MLRPLTRVFAALLAVAVLAASVSVVAMSDRKVVAAILAPDEFAVGETVVVNDANVPMRSAPSTSAAIAETLAQGTSVVIIAPAQSGDGFTWWPVQHPATGVIGFVRAEMLSPIAASSATPETAASAGPAALIEMLALVPDNAVRADDPSTHRVQYANLAVQLKEPGVSIPDASFAFAIAGPLDLNDIFRGVDYWTAGEESRKTVFGFDLDQIDQAIGGGPSDAHFALLRGRFDQQAARDAWTRAGYRWTEESGIAVARYGEDGEIDFSNDTTNIVWESAAYDVAFLPDGTLALASSIELLRAVIEVAVNGAPTLAARPDVQTLLAGLPDDLAAVVIADGTGFADCGGDAWISNPNIPAELRAKLRHDAEQMLAAYGPMSPTRLIAIGRTTGGPVWNPAGGAWVNVPGLPLARTVISVLYDDANGAETAAKTIAGRLDAGMSTSTRVLWAEIFPERTIRALPDYPVVAIVLTPADISSISWNSMFESYDYLFLLYQVDESACDP